MWFLSPTGAFWASVGIILGLVGTYYLFRTKLTIEPDATLDPKNPLVTPFRITNDGVLSIYDVDRSCDIRLIKASNITVSNVNVINAVPKIPKLRTGEQTSLTIPSFPNRVIPIVPTLPFENVDVEIVVKYKTLFRLQREIRSRFDVMVLSDGSYQWFHKALSE
jgi:hypothetical protein